MRNITEAPLDLSAPLKPLPVEHYSHTVQPVLRRFDAENRSQGLRGIKIKPFTDFQGNEPIAGAVVELEKMKRGESEMVRQARVTVYGNGAFEVERSIDLPKGHEWLNVSVLPQYKEYLKTHNQLPPLQDQLVFADRAAAFIPTVLRTHSSRGEFIEDDVPVSKEAKEKVQRSWSLDQQRRVEDSTLAISYGKGNSVDPEFVQTGRGEEPLRAFPVVVVRKNEFAAKIRRAREKRTGSGKTEPDKTWSEDKFLAFLEKAEDYDGEKMPEETESHTIFKAVKTVAHDIFLRLKGYGHPEYGMIPRPSPNGRT